MKCYVRIWDAETGTLQQSFENHTDRVWAVAFSPDGQRLASGCADAILDAEKGILQKILKCDQPFNAARAVVFSPDGQRLASASSSIVQIWDTKTWDRQHGWGGDILEASRGTWGIAFSPDGQWLASASFDGTLRLQDAKMGSREQVLHGHTSTARAIAFSPDGRQLASASEDRTMRLWDVNTGAQITSLEHDDVVNTVAFSANGRGLASGSNDSVVRVWDSTEGTQRKALRGHTNQVWAVAFSNDW
jgi:WD40 repeat protein